MSLLQHLEAALVRGCLALVRAMPPDRASDFAGAVARGIGPLLPVSRVAHDNLRRAMPELDRAARRRIVRGVWDSLGRTMGELPHLPALHRTDSGPGWEVDGADILRELAAHGGPAIFFSGHIANWELLPPIVATFGPRMSSMYRAPDNPIVDDMLIRIRSAAMGGQATMLPKGAAGARGAMAHLSRGGFVGILMDQKMNDGIPAPFFGRPAMTASALAALALRFRCPVIPGHVRRLGPARYRLVVEPPLPLPATGDRTADLTTLTEAVNARLEAWIRARPESWLWLHRRWGKGAD